MRMNGVYPHVVCFAIGRMQNSALINSPRLACACLPEIHALLAFGKTSLFAFPPGEFSACYPRPLRLLFRAGKAASSPLAVSNGGRLLPPTALTLAFPPGEVSASCPPLVISTGGHLLPPCLAATCHLDRETCRLPCSAPLACLLLSAPPDRGRSLDGKRRCVV